MRWGPEDYVVMGLVGVLFTIVVCMTILGIAGKSCA